MIDAIKEIKAIRQQGADVNNIVDDLTKQAVDIDKKKHLVKSIALASDIQELINCGEFENHGIGSINIKREWNKTGFKLIYILKSKDGYKLGNNVSDSDYGRLISKLNDLFSLFDNHNEKYVNDSLIYRYANDPFIDLSSNIENKILNLLLNPELLKILNYSDLHINLNAKQNSNQIIEKKVKL